MPRPILYVGPAKLPPLADETAGYIDFFSDQHANEQPVVLIDRTSVKWPASYTPELAAIWRRHKGIVRPAEKSPLPKRKTLHLRG